MLEVIGNTLVWIALAAIIPLMLLPLARLISGDSRTGVTVIWLLLTIGVVGAGLIFSHYAVDLPRIQLDARYGIWLTATAGFTAITGFIIGPSKAINTFSSIFSTITRITGRGAMWLIIIMALVQFTIVIMRYVFGLNFIWMQESVTYFHGAVFLLTAGYALLTNDHVRVDIFYRDAPPRRKALVDFVGTYLFLFPFCLMILWTAAPYVGNAWAVREGSTEQSGIQGVYLLKTLVPLFATLLAMAGFAIAAKAAETLRERG